MESKEPQKIESKDPQFDFALVGKRMPYSTPEGYFEQSAAAITRTLDIRRRRTLYRRWYGAAAACVVLLLAVGITKLYLHNEAMAATPIYYQAADGEQNDWAGFAESDLFLENMNW